MTDQTNLPAVAEDSRLSFGQTEVRPQDIVAPRVKVIQQMSKEAADGLGSPGDFYNTLTGENYGPSLRIQPIQTFMQRIFLVRDDPARRKPIEKALKDLGQGPLSDGAGLKCRSFDMYQGIGEPGILCEGDEKASIPPCPFSQWHRDGGDNIPPLCTETWNVAAVTELGELVLVGFSRSSAKVGKRLFSALRLRTVTAPPWQSYFDLQTRAERNDKGNFFVPDFRIVTDPRPDTAQLRQAVAWASQLKGVQLDVTPDVDDEPTTVDGEEGDDSTSPF